MEDRGEGTFCVIICKCAVIRKDSIEPEYTSSVYYLALIIN